MLAHLLPHFIGKKTITLSGGDNLPMGPHLSQRISFINPSPEDENRKLEKCLGCSRSPCFMGVKCSGCYEITTVFSHVQMVVSCAGGSMVLHQPTGGSTLNPGECVSLGPCQGNTFWIEERKQSEMRHDQSDHRANTAGSGSRASRLRFYHFSHLG